MKIMSKKKKNGAGGGDGKIKRNTQNEITRSTSGVNVGTRANLFERVKTAAEEARAEIRPIVQAQKEANAETTPKWTTAEWSGECIKNQNTENVHKNKFVEPDTEQEMKEANDDRKRRQMTGDEGGK